MSPPVLSSASSLPLPPVSSLPLPVMSRHASFSAPHPVRTPRLYLPMHTAPLTLRTPCIWSYALAGTTCLSVCPHWPTSWHAICTGPDAGSLCTRTRIVYF
eukprot:2373386-Rhodomonas_salina.1